MVSLAYFVCPACLQCSNKFPASTSYKPCKKFASACQSSSCKLEATYIVSAATLALWIDGALSTVSWSPNNIRVLNLCICHVKSCPHLLHLAACLCFYHVKSCPRLHLAACLCFCHVKSCPHLSSSCLFASSPLLLLSREDVSLPFSSDCLRVHRLYFCHMKCCPHLFHLAAGLCVHHLCFYHVKSCPHLFHLKLVDSLYVYHLWPDFGKPSVKDPRAIRVFSSSGRNLSKSRFCHTCGTTLPLTVAVFYGG